MGLYGVVFRRLVGAVESRATLEARTPPPPPPPPISIFTTTNRIPLDLYVHKLLLPRMPSSDQRGFVPYIAATCCTLARPLSHTTTLHACLKPSRLNAEEFVRGFRGIDSIGL